MYLHFTNFPESIFCFFFFGLESFLHCGVALWIFNSIILPKLLADILL